MYWSQVFLLPQKVVKFIQVACRTFLWTGNGEGSKRALVAWDRIMLPQQAGGLNIINLKLWNRAAICKHLWNLAQEKDIIWIKWVHGYYIKQQNLYEMQIPHQSSWVVRKIMGVRAHLQQLTRGEDWIRSSTFSVRKMYLAFTGQHQKVPWAKMICQNSAPPKHIFISWLLLNGRMATCSYVQKFGIQVDSSCCLCKKEQETVDHLFFQCDVAAAIWRDVMDWGGIARPAGEWSQEYAFLVTQCTNNNGRQKLYCCIVAILIYQVWKERNRRRMKGVATNPMVVVQQCKVLVSVCGSKDRKIAKLLKRG